MHKINAGYFACTFSSQKSDALEVLFYEINALVKRKHTSFFVPMSSSSSSGNRQPISIIQHAFKIMNRLHIILRF